MGGRKKNDSVEGDQNPHRQGPQKIKRGVCAETDNGDQVLTLPADIDVLLQFDATTLEVSTREGKNFEFKRDFVYNDFSIYTKTLAAFSNAQGGVLVFGVGDKPRKIVGATRVVDEAEWADRLRQDFEPEIIISTRVYLLGQLQLIAVGVDRSSNRPIICRKTRTKSIEDRAGKIKDAEVLHEGSIYYRYAGQTKAITHSELAAMLADQERARIQIAVRNLQDVGIANIGEANVSVPASLADAPRPSEGSVQQRPVKGLSPDDVFFVPEVRLNDVAGQVRSKTAKEYSYYVYTKRFDEAVRAQEMAEPGELRRLYEWLKNVDPPNDTYEEFAAQIFKDRGSVGSIPPSMSITLLLDNSGSMRGEKITRLASSALSLIELLERWHVRTEVLGYTTRAWKGGQARELWLKDGKPHPAGRLNDLRHIIYKTFDETTSESAPNLGLMLREGILKENIDGEALLWAHSRLIQERSNAKILFMFTDGAPVDDSTLSLQRKNFLYDHLDRVVHSILDEQRVLFQLVGIDYDHSNVLADAANVTDWNMSRPVFNAIRALIYGTPRVAGNPTSV